MHVNQRKSLRSSKHMLHARNMKIMLIEVSNTSLIPNKIMEDIRMLSMGSTTIHPDFRKMEFHDYVSKAIALVRSKDIMVYARGNNHG